MFQQKQDGIGSGAGYESLDNVTSRHKGCLRWTGAAIFLLGVGIAISMIGPPSNEQVIVKHMKSSSPIQVQEDGSLALFDNSGMFTTFHVLLLQINQRMKWETRLGFSSDCR